MKMYLLYFMYVCLYLLYSVYVTWVRIYIILGGEAFVGSLWVASRDAARGLSTPQVVPTVRGGRAPGSAV